jgi:hypothetical protein
MPAGVCQPSAVRRRFDPVMAGLVPALHVLLIQCLVEIVPIRVHLEEQRAFHARGQCFIVCSR